jgi:plasmid stability protein
MEPLWFHDATVTLKNIPADLPRELKKRAEEHHRNLNKKIIATLKSATSGTAIRQRSLTAEEASHRESRRDHAGSKGVCGFDLGGPSTRFELEMLGL